MYTTEPPADEVGALPDWLTFAPSSGRRVHVSWARDWRAAMVRLLADEMSDGWDPRFTLRTGDVVLTVLATTPPLVVLAELVGERETVADGEVAFGPAESFRFPAPLVWDDAHFGRPGRGRGPTTLRTSDAPGVLAALAREHGGGSARSFDVGACGADTAVGSAFHVVRLYEEAFRDGWGQLTRVGCAACRVGVDVGDVVVHRTGPDASVLMCERCHAGTHAGVVSATGSPCLACGAVDQALRVVPGRPPGLSEWREPGVVYWGCVVIGPLPQWQCRVCRATYGVRGVL